jgi:hypothetical protein
MLITALLMTGLLAAGPSPEEPASGQDSVVATAPATSVALDATARPVAPAVSGAAQSADPHGLSTDQQIARWLAARASEPATAEDESPVWRDDRKMHSEFDVGFGTGGYRSYGAAVSLPLGESGRLDISIRQTENDPYRYGYGAGYDPYFADSGYAFPGHATPGASLDYERRLSRPEGPPNRPPAVRSQQTSEE